jgi:hypothetical protein
MFELDRVDSGELDAISLLTKDSTIPVVSNISRILQDLTQNQLNILSELECMERQEATGGEV